MKDKAIVNAKPPKHEETGRHSKDFEHKDITDNRLVWEVLEEGEASNA